MFDRVSSRQRSVVATVCKTRIISGLGRPRCCRKRSVVRHGDAVRLLPSRQGVIARRRVVCNCVCVKVSKAASSSDACREQRTKKKKFEEQKSPSRACPDAGRRVLVTRSCLSLSPAGAASPRGRSLESRCTPSGSSPRRQGTWKTHEPRARIARGSSRAKARRSGAERAAMRRGPRGAGSPGCWCSDTKAV